MFIKIFAYLCALMKRFLSVVLLLLAVCVTLAQSVADSVQVSLLTCSPGTEVYALYGHTAIRCRTADGTIDEVYNYGVFSFDTPFFIWRFILGECDYIVAPTEWRYFEREYLGRGSRITEQKLNLTAEEAKSLWVYLVYNARPENRTYRYNFLFNNCTTKVRDVLEEVLRSHSEQIGYMDSEEVTFREILHQYALPGSWAAEGNDFLLGASVDTLLCGRSTMFAPEYLMRYADTAVISLPDGSSRPLVKETEVFLPEKTLDRTCSFLFSPFQMAMSLLFMCLLVLCLEQWRRRMFWGVDVLLMTLQGLAGTLLVFMFLCSRHPAVDTNWLVCLFHPLPLVALPFVVSAARGHRRSMWHIVNIVLLLLFLLAMPWLPQDFGVSVLPLTLALMTRPLSYLINYYREKTYK